MSATRYGGSNGTHGRIELIIGPMFAGKTTELMRRVRRELFARRSCYIIKHSRDVRYNAESVSSHDNLLLGATSAVSELRMVGDAWTTYDVVAVDEGQFFPDIVEFCNTVADAGKTVIVSALDGDYRRKPFDDICRLIPLAEYVKKLSSVCMMCHSRSASFTYRTVASDERELIGGADMYIATCRSCYIAKEEEKRVAADACRVERTRETSATDEGDEKRRWQQDVTTPEMVTAANSDSPSSAVDPPPAAAAAAAVVGGDEPSAPSTRKRPAEREDDPQPGRERRSAGDLHGERH